MKFCTLLLLVFVNCSAGVILNCDFKQFNYKNIELYSCVTDDLITTEGDNYIVEVNGEHKDGKTHEDVKQISVFNQSVEYFPGGLANSFPNLEAVNIKNSSLKFIFKTDLISLSKLKYFAVAGNEIEVIGQSIFDDNLDLEEIHFENNRISNIDGGLLEDLTNLTVLHFYNNFCIKEDLDTRKFSINEIKNNLIQKCPTISNEKKNELFEKQVEKLSTQVRALEDKISDDKKKKAQIVTPEEDLKESEKLQIQVDKLEFEKKFLLIDASLANQTLENNTLQIQNLTDELNSYKIKSESLEANLTTNLVKLNETETLKEELEAQVINLTEELKRETMKSSIWQEIIFPKTQEIISLKSTLTEVQEQLSSIEKIKDDEIAVLKKDLNKAVSERNEIEKDSKAKIAALQSVNKELNKATTMVGANNAFYDRLESRYQK